MGIDINTYRARIGKFALCIRQRMHNYKYEKYRSHHSGTDIHLRTFVVSIFTVGMFAMFYGVLYTQHYVEDNFSVSGYTVCDMMTYISPRETTPASATS